MTTMLHACCVPLIIEVGQKLQFFSKLNHCNQNHQMKELMVFYEFINCC